MPKIMLGDSPTHTSWLEYYGAILPKGTPVEFVSKGEFLGPAKSGVGTVAYSWWYDGIILEVDCVGGGRIGLHLALGDRVRRVPKGTDIYMGAGI